VPLLFHFVPERMAGTVLYPLNALRDHEPQLWRREVAKYEGREHVLEKSIPPLGCLWNDVLHFSVIRPSLVAGELKEVGIDLPRRRFFEIDADALEPRRTVIFLNRPSEGSHDTDESQWLPYDTARLLDLDQMSEATRRYYRESTALGQQPLLYRYLPHVLFHGQLETQGCPVHGI
jgi:hypothetical protein